MDHLPLPSGGRNVFALSPEERNLPAEHMKVPILSEAKYDGKGIDGALSRMGTSEEHILQSLKNNHDGDPFLDSCIQQYCFIALLQEFHEILELNNYPSPIARLADGTEVATTKFLIDYTMPQIWTRLLSPLLAKGGPSGPDGPEILQQVPDLTENMDELQKSHVLTAAAATLFDKTKKQRVHSLLDKMAAFQRKVVSALDAVRLYYRKPDNLRFRICLSAALLLEMLLTMSNGMLGIFPELGVIGVLPSRHLKNTLLQFIRQQGWCLWNTWDISAFRLSCVYVTALLPALEDRDHSDCSASYCFANNLSTPLKGIHRSDCHGECAELQILDEDLEKYFNNGDFPVLIDGGEKSQIVTSPSKDAPLGYVAISHVWSHGLGNDDRNAIPSCQLSHIWRIISNLKGRGYALWLDTLCVPVDGKLKTHRKHAISMMRDVYRDAAAVVLLDEKLQKVGESEMERRLYLLFSDWMHRVWTLQEVLLPGLNKVFVKFKGEHLVPLSDLAKVHAQVRYALVMFEWALALTIGDKFQVPQPPGVGEKDRRDMSAAQSTDLATLAEAFNTRDTSKPRDEAICLGVLLGLDMRALADEPTMEHVYAALETFPASIIFCIGRRLSTPGFRSLPRSFRRIRSAIARSLDELSSEKEQSAALTPQGVWCAAPGFIFEDYRLCFHEENTFSAIIESRNTSIKFICTSHPWINKDLLRGKRMAAILKSDFSYEYFPEASRYCFLATDLKENDDGNWSCRYLSFATAQYIAEPGNIKSLKLMEMVPTVTAEHRPGATWTID